jgi:hypothetical protein
MEYETTERAVTKQIIQAPGMTPHKAAEIAGALERSRKELARIAEMLPRGFGDNRTADFSIAVGCIAAQAGEWCRIMWDITQQLKRAA